jgi:uncharacterized membrane-anchored protein
MSRQDDPSRPNRALISGVLAACLLASMLSPTLVFASPPPPIEADENVAAPAEGEPAAEPPTERAELPPWMIEQDPVAAARLAAMSDEAYAKLLDSASNNFESLTPEELAVLELISGQMEREFDETLTFQTGEVTISNGLATLHLSDEYRFLGPDDSRKVLVEGWGNPPSSANGVLGMIFPANMRALQEGSWGVILTFSPDGYVDDDDADDLDYDELLEELKAGSEADNKQRVAEGYPPMHLQGWAEQPHYDESKHALYWALSYDTQDPSDDALNFAIRVLGRRGVLELNGIAALSQLEAIKPAMEDVYGMVEYNAGHRYDDFDPDLDKVAAYGIGGLILGKVAMKAGLFAGLLKLLLAGKKFLLLGLIGLGALVRRMTGRKEPTDTPPSDG